MNDVHVYITTCLICQNKAIHCHKSYNQLESLLISKNMWNSSFKKISLDWVMRLSFSLKNDQEYNSILIIICCVTKYALFLLIWNDCTAADFMKLFFEHVECYFDFLKSIMMNKDSHITSDFWQEVCEIQIIKWHLFTAYHSQTDDQSEVLNRIIENYLRVYTFKDQMMWARLLFLVQFIYNNSHNHITQLSLN